MRLDRYLSSLGYGTRRDVEAMCRAGRVTTRTGQRLRGDEALGHAEVLVDEAPLDPPPGALLLYHKPVGETCSVADRGRLIYDSLPSRFRARRPVMSPVGRLDKDTSGALLLTDDGPLLHALTSPRRHLPRVYRATLASPLRGDETAIFGSGTLMLQGETTPLQPATLEPLDAHVARLTLGEGRYHQVRRMFAAIGNHVTALHREAFGPITLADLAEGSWRLLAVHERARLDAALRSVRDGGPPAP